MAPLSGQPLFRSVSNALSCRVRRASSTSSTVSSEKFLMRATAPMEVSSEVQNWISILRVSVKEISWTRETPVRPIDAVARRRTAMPTTRTARAAVARSRTRVSHCWVRRRM